MSRSPLPTGCIRLPAVAGPFDVEVPTRGRTKQPGERERHDPDPELALDRNLIRGSDFDPEAGGFGGSRSRSLERPLGRGPASPTGWPSPSAGIGTRWADRPSSSGVLARTKPPAIEPASVLDLQRLHLRGSRAASPAPFAVASCAPTRPRGLPVRDNAHTIERAEWAASEPARSRNSSGRPSNAIQNR